ISPPPPPWPFGASTRPPSRERPPPSVDSVAPGDRSPFPRHRVSLTRFVCWLVRCCLRARAYEKGTMQALARASRGIAAAHGGQMRQQARGIVVQVRDGNLDRALTFMERKMRSSGMERLIRARTHHHVKDSEKRVLARKALMQRVKSQELGKKLREILIKKIRGQ
ncbi:unnamed protein product, partial [Urochloa humidicola]